MPGNEETDVKTVVGLRCDEIRKRLKSKGTQGGDERQEHQKLKVERRKGEKK